LTQPDQSNAIREHAWKHFEVHASQRMTVFNYFLAVSGALAAGLATTLQGTARFSVLGIALGGLLALVSFIFWKLDQRVSFLIKRAELALSEIERHFPSPAAQLFLREPEEAEAARKASTLWSRPWTYGRAFRFVFSAMAVFGTTGATLSTLKFVGVVSW
jgi:cyanate permease